MFLLGNGLSRIPSGDFWRGAHPLGKFFGTAAMLGFGRSVVACETPELEIFAAPQRSSSLTRVRRRATSLCFGAVDSTDAELTHALPTQLLRERAHASRFRLGMLLRGHIAAVVGIGGVVLPAVASSRPRRLGLAVFAVRSSGEFTERYCFFRCGAPRKCPEE